MLAILIVACNGLLTSCSADAYEESLIHDTQATEGDDEQITPPPPPPPDLNLD